MHESAALSRAPWEALPRAAAPRLAPAIPALVDEVLAAVVHAVPEYEGVIDSNVRTGVRQALEGFLELAAAGDRARLPAREVYVRFGRGEHRAGRSLDALLHAYRVGAQVAWRGIARAGDEASLDPHALYALAEAIFAYIDELSAASAEGFAYEQSMAAHEQQEQRGRLLEALLTDPPPPKDELGRAANEAGWTLPDTLAVLAFQAEHPTRVAARLPATVLVARVEGLGWALVPDPEAPGRAAQVHAALGRGAGALGPTVTPAEAHESARRARHALDLIGPSPGELIHADDHLLDLALLGDRALATELCARALEPLEHLKPGTRARLLETLKAFIDEQGHTQAMAERMHLHPQTVRYRVGRLRDVLGEGLDDPNRRLELAVAMRIDERDAAG